MATPLFINPTTFNEPKTTTSSYDSDFPSLQSVFKIFFRDSITTNDDYITTSKPTNTTSEISTFEPINNKNTTKNLKKN